MHKPQFTVSISHIDTCTPEYLQDHHNRPGELLLQVVVDGSTTYADILAGLQDDFCNADFYNLQADLAPGYEYTELELRDALDAAISAEIENTFANVVDMNAIFDRGLDCPPSDDPDSDEYNRAVESIEPTERGGNEAEIAQFRYDAMRDAQRAWENRETCYVYFLVTYELMPFAEAVLNAIRFNVTYDVVTNESAQHGDFAESGFAAQKVTLLEAIAECASSSHCRNFMEDSGSWFSYTQEIDWFDGSTRTNCIHPPRSITQSSYNRLKGLLDWRCRKR